MIPMLPDAKRKELVSTGYLYKHFSYRYERSCSDKMDLEGSWFNSNTNGLYNDCVPHALNYFLGFPFYTTREQVIR